jgi:hypothetical protein
MVDVCYSSEKRTSVERTGGIFRWKPRPATNSAMDDFPIVPPLIVKDMPRPRRLTTLKAARDYVAEAMRLHWPTLGANCGIASRRSGQRKRPSKRSATSANCSWMKICCCRPKAQRGDSVSRACTLGVGSMP